MIVGIIGLIIGILIAGGGLYYLIQEKQDAQSKKIYGITSVVGVVIALAMVLKLAL